MASSTTDIVKVFYATISLMGADKAAHFLSPDFTLVGWTAAPVDKAAWMRFLVALKQALPDLKFHLSSITDHGSTVEFTEVGEGTHTGRMDMSALDMPDIPASGKRIRFPGLRWRYTVEKNKIQRAELILEPPQTQGLDGFLEAFADRPAAVV